MPHVDHILVPVELHENADPIVAWAALLARQFHSRLTLFHVNESFEAMKRHPLATEDREAWQTTYTREARSSLARLIARHCEGLSVATELAEGRASATILDRLKKNSTALVVMGTHGRPWHERVILGSTADRLLRTAPCPIFVVPNFTGETTPPRLETLLLPTDFSVDGMVSEEWALRLAEKKKVLLLHVIENPLLDTYDPDKVEVDFRKAMEEARTRPPRSALPFWEQAHRVTQAKLTLLGRQFSAIQVQVETLVSEGAAAPGILDAAEKNRVDLIVMSTHGRSGVRRLFLGSVAETTIRSARCPVLAVHNA